MAFETKCKETEIGMIPEDCDIGLTHLSHRTKQNRCCDLNLHFEQLKV